MEQEQARGQKLARLYAVAVRALGFQSCLFFLECGAHFKNGLALLALKIVERHKLLPEFCGYCFY